MRSSDGIPFTKFWRNAHQWWLSTPEKALDEAYNAAWQIKALEEQNFHGQTLNLELANQGDFVKSYFQGELKKHLKIIDSRLAIFNTSRFLLDLTVNFNQKSKSESEKGLLSHVTDLREHPENTVIILDKLAFIDGVVSKYKEKSHSAQDSSNSVGKVSSNSPSSLSSNSAQNVAPLSANSLFNAFSNTTQENNNPPSPGEVTVLPRSILGTINRITKELDPESEQEMISNFRKSKVRTIISIRFMLLLILIPLLTQQLSKSFIVLPIVHYFQEKEALPLFINEDLEEKAFIELERFEKKIKFQAIIGKAPEISSEQMEEKVKEKALQLAESYQEESSNAIANIFADLFSVLAFAVVIKRNKKHIDAIKSFMDDLIYGLSDSAKAFIIILFTDVFVGFHSSHGWEIVLEGLSHHLGIPENRGFIFLFIATFPVILDTVFKYWIFRYLNRSSPSAVATYRNMNE
ncbi:MAG: hypothetical protein RLZZ338_2059 [Cyanobacteriota bacterium]|jgi:hypothetical protein